MLWTRISTAAVAAAMPYLVATAPTSQDPDHVASLPIQRIRNQTAYGVELSLGTPPQKVVMLLDTGSPTYSASSPINPICKRGLCAPFGTYDNTTSSTTKWISDGFGNLLINRGYGSVVNDTIAFGQKSLSNMQFGVVEGYGASFPITTPLPTIFGVGAICTSLACDAYPTFLQQIYDRGVIASRSFSVYLGPDTPDFAGGEIIFGGYDGAKRDGPSHKFKVQDPTLPDSNRSPNYVPVAGISYTRANGTKSTNAFANNTYSLWDTGASAWSLPDDIFTAVAGRLGINATARSPYVVDCAHLYNKKEFITVSFPGGLNIDVSLGELVTRVTPGHCISTISSNGPTGTLFGDAFLRSVYFTFNYDELTVEISKVRNTPERRIVPILRD